MTFFVCAALIVLAAGGCRSKKADAPLSGPEGGGPAPAPVAAPAAAPPPAPAEAKGGPKVLMVIACPDFRDEELFTPRKIFEEKGLAVTVAANAKGPCTGMMGGTAAADLLVKEARAADYDAVVFVGGLGAKVFFDDKDAHALAADAAGQGKVTAAICIAPSILARAGVLKGRKATVWKGETFTAILAEGGARLGDGDVVVDGKIVTADGPEAAASFAAKVIEAMGK